MIDVDDLERGARAALASTRSRGIRAQAEAVLALVAEVRALRTEMHAERNRANVLSLELARRSAGDVGTQGAELRGLQLRLERSLRELEVAREHAKRHGVNEAGTLGVVELVDAVHQVTIESSRAGRS